MSKLFKLHAPIFGVLIYVLSTILIFWYGPIEWPVENPFELALFQLFVILFIVLGYFSFSVRRIKLNLGPNFKNFFYVGVVFTIAIQIPITLTYTNKFPWEALQSIFDQKATYEEMLAQVADLQGTRFFVPLFRSLIMPFFYASLAYGILNFSKLSQVKRLMLVILILCPIDLSVLRGTDKEIFDIFIICGGLGLISFWRTNLNHEGRLRVPVRSILSILIIVLILSVALLIIFSQRKYERMGSADAFCFVDGLICADYSGAIISSLPNFVQFGLSMVTFYLANGYYGLSLALSQPYEFSYGIGHSSALLSLAERISGNTLAFDSTLISKLSEAGWDHKYYWATFFPWVASDVGFLGSLVVLGIISRWFRQAWLDAVYAKNDAAAVVFVLLCVLFFYLPANNQITQTFDLYFSFLIFMCLWKFYKNKGPNTYVQ
jgi:hypothetical protein